MTRIVVAVAVQGSYGLGDMVAWIGDGQLISVSSPIREALAGVARAG